jgi:hypothetical protein
MTTTAATPGPGPWTSIAYVVSRPLGREMTLTQTKLVKLLYVIDVERAVLGRESLTGLPWTPELDEELAWLVEPSERYWSTRSDLAWM